MPKESLATLIAELVHEEDWRRMRATAACLAGGPKAVEELIRALGGAGVALKVEIAGMLARLKDPRAGVPLAGLLKDGDPLVRKAAAVALEQMAGVLDAAAAEALARMLSEDLAEESRALVQRLLGTMPNAVGPLGAMLKHPDAQARLLAAESLERLLDPRCADALVDAMGDHAVRDAAARTLKKLGAVRQRIDEAFDALRDVEESGQREAARMATVIELLAIGRPAVEILIEYLEDDDWVVREAAADLLGKIGDVRAVEPLMRRLKVDKDTGVKEYALKSLGLIGDARPVDLYLDAIGVRPLRVFAMEALAKVKQVEVLAPHLALFERLKTDRDGLVSYNAGVIVDKLKALAMETETAAGAAGHDQQEGSNDE